jgi:hypothetical protein
MSTRLKQVLFRLHLILAMGVALALLPLAAQSSQQRPLSDFLSAQGTFCVDDGGGGCLLFVPPDPNFLGWQTMFPPPKLPIVRTRPEVPLFGAVDYAGLADAYAPGHEPSITGTVTERVLRDGRALITVLLHTSNANAWVIDLDLAGDILDQIANKPTLFGHRPHDALLGAPQALADSLLHVEFIIPAPGGPLPDLLQLVNFGVEGMELEVLSFQSSAFGPLNAPFGVPDNTPGKLTISQVGLIPNFDKGRALADAFPVETVILSVVSAH